jgi:hypothetical protein
MKKSISLFWYLLFFLLFPFLFYNQTIGLNVFVYSTALIGFWLFVFGKKTKTASGIMWLVANLISALSVATYGSVISVITLLVVVSSTAVFVNQNNVNPVSSFLAGLKTFALSPFSITSSIKGASYNGIRSIHFFLYILLPTTIVIGFAVLYAMSDNLFADLLSRIHIDIFKFRFLMTTAFGLILIYTIVSTKVSRKRARLERQAGIHAGNKDRFPINLIPREHEAMTGSITLALLNLLLFAVLFTDIRFRVLGEQLPESLNHSAYLHQGIFALILSIVCAISILAWLYRTKGNSRPLLRTLSIIWLFQNSALVVLNVLRNNSYINEFSLTYKRIGVYFYLLFAILGLCFTLVYVLKRLNMLRLVKLNSYSILFVFVLASPIPWDHIITKYNTDRAIKTHKTLDLSYILSLKNADLNYVNKHRESVLGVYEQELLRYRILSVMKAEEKKKLWSKTLYQANQTKLYNESDIQDQN